MSRNLSLVCCSFFFGLLFSCSDRQSSSNDQEFDEKHEQYKESRKVRSMGLADVPEFQNKQAEEYYFLGNKARNSGDYETAKEYFLKSYQFDSTHVVNLNNLANSCLYLNEPEEAERYLAKAYFLDTTAGITYANYMNFALSQGLFRPGIECGLKGLILVEDSMALGIINMNLSILYARIDQCDSALFCLRNAARYEELLDSKAVMSVEEEIHTLCKGN